MRSNRKYPVLNMSSTHNIPTASYGHLVYGIMGSYFIQIPIFVLLTNKLEIAYHKTKTSV